MGEILCCYMIPKVHGGDWQAGVDRIYRELEAGDADLLIMFFDSLLDGSYQEKCREITAGKASKFPRIDLGNASETFVNFKL